MDARADLWFYNAEIYFVDFSYIVIQLIKRSSWFCCWFYFFFFLSNELLDEAEQRAFVLIKCIICPQTTKFSHRIRKLNVQKCTQLQNIIHYIFLYFHHLPTNNQMPKSILVNHISKNAHSYLNINFIKSKHIVQFVIYFLASVPEYFLVFIHSTCCHLVQKLKSKYALTFFYILQFLAIVHKQI